MNRGVAKQTTFFSDEDRIEFGRLLHVGHERFGVKVHAYCLMDNHYHLVLHCPHAGLSDFMHHLGSVLTRHVNDRVQRDGPLYRGRFRSIPVTSDQQLLMTTRYVHRNALDVRGIDDVSDYRWSSHRTYLGHRHAPAWMDLDLVLGSFNGNPLAFDQFVANDREDSDTRFDMSSLTAVVDLVAEERSAGGDGIGPGVRRTLLLLVLARVRSDCTRRAIAELLEFTDQRLLDKAVWRARRRATSDPQLSSIVDHIFVLVGKS